jgi:hypothetical protein
MLIYLRASTHTHTHIYIYIYLIWTESDARFIVCVMICKESLFAGLLLYGVGPEEEDGMGYHILEALYVLNSPSKQSSHMML